MQEGQSHDEEVNVRHEPQFSADQKHSAMRTNLKEKKRHVLATIWLVILAIGNGVASPLYLLGYPPGLREAIPRRRMSFGYFWDSLDR